MPSATGSGTGCSTPGTASLGWYQATSRMLLAGWLRIREMYVHSEATKTPTAATAEQGEAAQDQGDALEGGPFHRITG